MTSRMRTGARSLAPSSRFLIPLVRPHRLVPSSRLFSQRAILFGGPIPTNTFSPSIAPGFGPSTSSGPPGETPKQRVGRLREANRQARLARQPPFERFLDRSRRWADVAHRVVAWGLIGFSVICGAVGAYAVFDMVMHNRRKRREYFSALREIHDKTVEEAEEAVRAGTVSEAQLNFLEKERRVKILEEADRQKRAETSGIINRIRILFVGDKKRPSDEEILEAAGPGPYLHELDSEEPAQEHIIERPRSEGESDRRGLGMLDELARNSSSRLASVFSRSG